MIPLPIPAWKAAAVLAVFAAGVLFGWGQGVKHTTARWNAERLERAEADAESQRLAARATEARMRADLEIRNAYHAQAKRDRAAAATARADADGLRDELAAITSAPADDSGSGCGIERAQRDELARLLGESGSLVEDGARLAREAANALDALRGREARVCVGAM